MENKIALRFTRHGLERLFQRQISPKDCEEVFESGEVIESYPDDKPFPSKLYSYAVKGRNLHVVIAIEGQVVHVITAYEPDYALWENDLKTRKKKK